MTWLNVSYYAAYEIHLVKYYWKLILVYNIKWLYIKCKFDIRFSLKYI